MRESERIRSDVLFKWFRFLPLLLPFSLVLVFFAEHLFSEMFNYDTANGLLRCEAILPGIAEEEKRRKSICEKQKQILLSFRVHRFISSHFSPSTLLSLWVQLIGLAEGVGMGEHFRAKNSSLTT